MKNNKDCIKENSLNQRLAIKSGFQSLQTKYFLSLLTKRYGEVAEIGCGKGFWTYVGAREKKFGNCSTCDVFSDLQVEEISPLVEKIEYVNITDNIFPYSDAKFDLVFSMDVIEHIEDDMRFIKENIRTIKSGGKIIIGTPNRGRVMNRILQLFGRLKFPQVIGKDAYGDVVHIREYSKEDLKKLVLKFSNLIDISSVEIIPCWYGVFRLNLGVNKLPKIFEPFCQFWFCVFEKK